MKGRDGSLGVIGAVAVGVTLLGTLAVGCGGGSDGVFVPVDSAGEDNNNPGQTTLLGPVGRVELASLPTIAFPGAT